MKQQLSVERQTICFFSDFLDVGGCENVLIDAIKGLGDQYEITVATMYGVSEEFRAKVGNSVIYKTNLLKKNYHPMDSIFLAFPILGPRLLKHYLPGHYDYLITVRPAYMMVAYTNIGHKTICWSHSDKDMEYANHKSLSFVQKLKKHIMKKCYRRLDATWVVADAIRDSLRVAFNTNNIYTLNNPIDCQNIINKSSDLSPLIMDSSIPRFVTVGRLSYEKGHMQLLRAFHRIRAEKPCQLIIVGDGPTRDALKSFISENHMDESVFLAGHQSNPYPYIRNADYLVLPSLCESFGLTILEAMLLKVPVITTATTGGRFLTSNGKYGLMVDNSEDGLVKGLETALSAPFSPETIRAAYEWAKTFDLSDFNQRLVELLNQ